MWDWLTQLTGTKPETQAMSPNKGETEMKPDYETIRRYVVAYKNGLNDGLFRGEEVPPDDDLERVFYNQGYDHGVRQGMARAFSALRLGRN